MKTTLVIDDQVMVRLKQEAARSGRTISELVETALRMFLKPAARAPKLPPLPKLRCGGLLVDVSNRDELHDALDGF
jgi:hypothetical protein